jgi:hypothetical protein
MKKNGIQPAVTMAEKSSAIFPPTTLCDLLTIAEESESKYVGMFKSTATAFISFVGRTAQDTPIDLLHTERDAFTRHLRAGKYTPASVKSYMNYVRMLLKLAVASGWSVPPFAVPNAWQAIWDALKNDATRRIVRYAIEQGKKPKNFSEDDLANWRLERARMGMSLGAADGSCSQFRSSLSKANLAASLPLIRVTKTSYGVRMSEMEPRLRLEIERLLEWKVSAYQPGRAANAQVRPITAKALSNHLCRMVGFVQNILGHAPLTSLRELVTSDLMHSYVKWTMNDRKLQAQGVIIGLGMLQAAMSQNPGYKDLDLDWLTVLSAGMPFEEQVAIDERKARKYILFSAADAIPSLIRKERLRHKQMKPRDYASSVRDELLMQWLIVLPWRQKNIRECRISGKSPNLVREPISPFSQVTQPTWIKEREKIKPGGKPATRSISSCRSTLSPCWKSISQLIGIP